MYKVPEKYYFRIHHVRPRFKNNIENVLIFVAEEIQRLGEQSCADFKESLNTAIRRFPGNFNIVEKTINNWRTEISSLFGFYIENKDVDITKASQRAIDLAENQDLVQFFKLFLYYFQYPGGHIKSHEIQKYIENGIKFKPACKILDLLAKSKEISGKNIGISKAEATHLLFNDLRVTTDFESIEVTAKRFLYNKECKTEYDWTGDVIRYAGDILDYMGIANLLKSYNGQFYLNNLEQNTIDFFINNQKWFTNYDQMISTRTANLSDIKDAQVPWFEFINQIVDENFFMTDILALISEDEEQYHNIQHSYAELLSRVESKDLRTKEIGDLGESLAFGHECKRISIGGREDLLHLIKLIPTSFAVGYDLQSVELDQRKRYIEVKTTISSKNISFHRFHLTPNEWNTAKSLSDRYFVYRLYISKEAKKLYILQDPDKLYKDSKIDMMLNSKMGMEITFDPAVSGQFQELLSWG